MEKRERNDDARSFKITYNRIQGCVIPASGSLRYARSCSSKFIFSSALSRYQLWSVPHVPLINIVASTRKRNYDKTYSISRNINFTKFLPEPASDHRSITDNLSNCQKSELCETQKGRLIHLSIPFP